VQYVFGGNLAFLVMESFVSGSLQHASAAYVAHADVIVRGLRAFTKHLLHLLHTLYVFKARVVSRYDARRQLLYRKNAELFMVHYMPLVHMQR
jgi:hypothetical protein